MLTKIKETRSLSKSKKIFKSLLKLYNQKCKTMHLTDKERLQNSLRELQITIREKNAIMAEKTAQKLTEESLRLMPRSTWDKARDLGVSIGFALLVAIVIRQCWFELYSIPTGSMRPTFKENDYLVVSKTRYGINVPLGSNHFYFDDTPAKRGSIVVFNGQNMDMPDDDTMYFYVIPGKKQYIKRLIGKPGDQLYFYGGAIYGIDKEGNEIRELLDPSYFQNIEHIPFIRFEGKTENHSSSQSTTIYQMNQPVAKLQVNAIGAIKGEIIPQKGHPALKNYSDLWGFKNYGMSRLLTFAQAKKLHPGSLNDLPKEEFYLEIHHHPSLQGGNLLRDNMGRIRPSLGTSLSLLPLSEAHLTQILNHMTTCRFVVKDGRVFRYGANYMNTEDCLTLSGVPNGTYEIQDGKAAEVLWNGVTENLAADHPLLKKEFIATLYNCGFEWSKYLIPSTPFAPLPSRYAYFRNGDLYLMGGPVVKKEDPYLISFLEHEQQRQKISGSLNPYFSFQDEGAPLKEDGSFNTEFIKNYGLTVPDKMYLAMGDNHAMSSDSRHFGFIPQNNIKGGASFIFWPAGDRFGSIHQPLMQYLTTSNMIVWALAGAIGLLSYVRLRRKYFGSLKFKD